MYYMLLIGWAVRISHIFDLKNTILFYLFGELFANELHNIVCICDH